MTQSAVGKLNAAAVDDDDGYKVHGYSSAQHVSLEFYN